MRANSIGQVLGRVVDFAYGDTITLLDNGQTQHKIRLGGIDAPEKAQPYGQQSSTKWRVKDAVADEADHTGLVFCAFAESCQHLGDSAPA